MKWSKFSCGREFENQEGLRVADKNEKNGEQQGQGRKSRMSTCVIDNTNCNPMISFALGHV